MSKFADAIKTHKIDPRRILATSSKLEKLRPEDRTIRLAKAKAKKSDDKKEAGGEAPKKPRSGRPITQRAIDAAMAGKPITGPQKTRMLRAVNAILEKKKASPLELKALF
jgi:hypothetical protein